MAERVDEFIREFEAAILSAERRSGLGSLVVEIRKSLRKAREGVLELNDRGVVLSVGIAELDRVDAELQELDGPSRVTAESVQQAKRLLQVIEDGFLEGDAARLRQLVDRVTTNTTSSKRPRNRSTDGLSIRVHCKECSETIGGHGPDGLRSWDGVAQAIRLHQGIAHPDDDVIALRAGTASGRSAIRAGARIADAARYQFEQLLAFE